MPTEKTNNLQMVLPNDGPITQWYKNNPPYAQVVKLTSNTIPDPTFAAFSNFSATHGFVLNKGFKSTTIPYVNTSGS
jgi:hypothetical protein